MTNKPKFIKLFTHNDLDGYSCDILTRLAFNTNNISIVHCSYNNIDKKIIDFVTSNVHTFYDLILIADISIKKETADIIEKLIDTSKIQLLDHHPTAINLNSYSWCKVIEEDEIEKVCGTSLLYDFLQENNYIEKKPSIDIFVETVKRYDTWLWHEKYNDIRAKNLNDLFYLYGPDKFSNEFCKRLSSDIFEMFTEKDEFLLEIENNRKDQYIERLSTSMTTKTLNIDNHKYKVGIVYAEQYISEAGNILSENNPELDFIAIISGLNSISYRTNKDNIHLGNIAKIMGKGNGGGHQKAAASKIDLAIKKQFESLIFK